MKPLDNLRWQTSIRVKAADTPESVMEMIPNARSIIIEGTAITDEANKNGWALDPLELDNVAAQLASGKIQLRVNHDSNVEGVVGRVLEAKRVGNRVDFVARVTTANPNVLLPIVMGDVDHSSIQADADKIVCSECRKDVGAMGFLCRCKDNHQVISQVKVKELSVVADPAYESTTIAPVGFAASVEARIKEASQMTDDQKKENEPSPLEKENAELKAEIAKMKAERKAEEEKKSEERKAEEEKRAEKKGEEESRGEEEKKAEVKRKSEEEKAEEKKAEGPMTIIHEPGPGKDEVVKAKSAGIVAEKPISPQISQDTLRVNVDPTVMAKAMDEITAFHASYGRPVNGERQG